MKVKELARLIEKDGWFMVRQRGSHMQFHHSQKKGTVTIAGKPSADVHPFVVNSVLKQADIKTPGAGGGGQNE
ncbi:MAG: type II toxin-antitoxin system HicA family toxin [Nitrospinae bacterium]|nr:type II toxin-antitoxin system HicA family toxin [Nitrospinota bacterium]